LKGFTIYLYSIKHIVLVYTMKNIVMPNLKLLVLSVTPLLKKQPGSSCQSLLLLSFGVFSSVF
jgi:hypothetical protein